MKEIKLTEEDLKLMKKEEQLIYKYFAGKKEKLDKI